jgi:hypothetical protein
MSAYDPEFIKPNVQAACDLLIANGFDQKVMMRINDDGTITLIDFDAYIAQINENEEMDDDD